MAIRQILWSTKIAILSIWEKDKCLQFSCAQLNNHYTNLLNGYSVVNIKIVNIDLFLNVRNCHLADSTQTQTESEVF